MLLAVAYCGFWRLRCLTQRPKGFLLLVAWSWLTVGDACVWRAAFRYLGLIKGSQVLGLDIVWVLIWSLSTSRRLRGAVATGPTLPTRRGRGYVPIYCSTDARSVAEGVSSAMWYSHSGVFLPACGPSGCGLSVLRSDPSLSFTLASDPPLKPFYKSLYVALGASTVRWRLFELVSPVWGLEGIMDIVEVSRPFGPDDW